MGDELKVTQAEIDAAAQHMAKEESHSCKTLDAALLHRENWRRLRPEAEAILRAAWNTRTETQSQATIDELVGALKQAEAILHNCYVTEGVCCCGDDMERHANPMDCGHTPVDHGSYVANQWLEDHAALLAKTDEIEIGGVR